MPGPFEHAAPTDEDALERAWSFAGRLLADAHDIVLGRVELDGAPAWCVARGWDAFLRSLSDEAAEAAGLEGLAAVARIEGAPPSLVAFARDVARAADVAPLPAAELPPGARGRRASDRKWAQVAAFAAASAPLARACERVVDVGSGHGHLTRHLAAAFGRPALGLERDAERVAVARALTSPAAGAVDAPRASFVEADLTRERLALRAGDLAVGLHACGELSDLALDAAADAGASVAFVSCCLQKARAPFRAARACPSGVDPARLRWPREALGLSNLAPRAQGVEASLERDLAARQNRWALAWLLRERGVEVEPGAEIAGVNRRRARAPLAEFVALVFARRGLAPPSAAELALAAEGAATSYARARRYDLPRVGLGRVVEAFVLYDRARALASRGYSVRAGTIFAAAVSPRNLALLAAPRCAHF
jgi:SAM-dependent methyltransferase